MNRTPTPPAAEITPSTSSEVNIVAENNCEQHTNKLDVESILIGIPKCYKNRARALLHFIADSPSISWDARGQLIVNSQVIESSHLTDLLKDCIHSQRSSRILHSIITIPCASKSGNKFITQEISTTGSGY